jgi:hypothetical protein
MILLCWKGIMTMVISCYELKNLIMSQFVNYNKIGKKCNKCLQKDSKESS